jgi:hypothetical protein
MRAIFIARGPAFPHKPNSRVEVFRKYSNHWWSVICSNISIQKTSRSTTLSATLSASTPCRTMAHCVSR